MRLGAGGLALALLALAGCAEYRVVRVIDGHEVSGRFISDDAYALYAQAAQEESAGGHLPRVLAALKAAAEADPASPEIWTKMGALYCRAPPGDIEHGEEALQQAEAIDPEYAPLFRERARCGLVAADRETTPEAQRKRLLSALSLAEHAMSLDPEDIPTQSLTAELLARAGKGSDARRLLAALIIRRPSSTEALRALHAFGRAHGDEALVLRASRRLHELGAEAPSDPRPRSPLAEIDAALGRDDLRAAQKLAHRARLPLSELAVRAAALGRLATARSQAEILVGADPSDTSARIALAVAADLAGNTAALAEAMTGLPAGRGTLTAPSPLARLLFAELLARRVGPDAAREFLGPVHNADQREASPRPSDAVADDDLRARVERRVLGMVSRTAPPRATAAP